MAGNIDPIYSKIGLVGAIAFGASANTKSDGAGTVATDLFKAFTADATNGSWVERIRCSPYASVAATATAATVIRIFISSQTSGTLTSANCWLFQEVAAPAQTADQTTVATNFIEVPLGFMLDPNYTILVSSHIVNNANTGWMAIVFGGKY